MFYRLKNKCKNKNISPFPECISNTSLFVMHKPREEFSLGSNTSVSKNSLLPLPGGPFCFFLIFLVHLQSELLIEPRYPLFGGWRATFVIGYGVPVQEYLFESADGARYLNYSFACPLAETVVDKLIIKVCETVDVF